MKLRTGEPFRQPTQFAVGVAALTELLQRRRPGQAASPPVSPSRRPGPEAFRHDSARSPFRGRPERGPSLPATGGNRPTYQRSSPDSASHRNPRRNDSSARRPGPHPWLLCTAGSVRDSSASPMASWRIPLKRPSPAATWASRTWRTPSAQPEVRSAGSPDRTASLQAASIGLGQHPAGFAHGSQALRPARGVPHT